MSDFSHEIANWVSGVITSVEGDKIADDALMGAKNTQFVKTGPGAAALGTRPGLTKATTFRYINATVNAKFLTSFPYAVNNSTSFSNYMLMIDERGFFYFKDPDDHWDEFEYSSTGGLGDPPGPSITFSTDLTTLNSTIIDNKLLVIAGPARRLLIGKTIHPFGIDSADVTVTVGNAAVTVPDTTKDYPNLLATDFPADTYDVFVTAYYSETGAESTPRFIGEYTTTANQAFRVVPISSTIHDYYRVYLRRQSTQANAYLVVNPKDSSSALLSSTGDIPIATTVYINPTIAEIADYIIPMPRMTENSKLSNEALYVASYGRRVIAASRRKLFYSKIDRPEAFPPENFELLDFGDGGEVVGLVAFEDELLLIFTTKSVYGLFGIDPQYWTLKPISLSIGCVGEKSIVKFDGGVAWWSPQAGPVIMRGQEIEKIGTERLDREMLDSIQPGLTGLIAGGWDPYHKIIAWSVPCRGSVKNNCVLPFQYELGSWCATEWDMFGVPVMATGVNGNKETRLFMMDHYESLYYLNSRDKFDGITPSMGTVEGSTSAATGVTTLTSSGFYVFSVLSTNMAGQKITFTDASGDVIDRREITSNTATVVNWSGAVDLVAGGKFYISTPLWEVSTKLFDGNQPFLRKRFDRLYVHMYAEDPARDLKIYYELNGQDKTKTFLTDVNPNSAETATLDVTWDVPVTVNVPLIKKRLSVHVNGHQLRWVFQYPEPGPVMLAKITTLGRVLSDRYYA